METLVLGGTGFLGRAVARQLVACGHRVTCLARGSQSVPPGATLVRADRDDPEALSPVTGRVWDAAIDLTSHPGHAARAADQIDTRQWIYVSSVSVYTDFSTPRTTEDAPTHQPLEAERFEDGSQYGAAKVACENAYRAVSSSTTIIRPALIGGWGDVTSRSGYYPWRWAHPTGADVLVPDETHLTAILDVEDLAAWMVHCAEQSVSGSYNAAGQPTNLAAVYEMCQELSGSTTPARIVSDEVLLAAEVQPWAGPRSLPLWIPDPAMRFLAVPDTSGARAHGLVTRPLVETLEAAGRYEQERDDARQAGLSDEEERELRGAVTG